MNLALRSTTALALALSVLGASAAQADMAAATAFLDETIERSALTREEQEAEMQWFVDAAQPFQGMEIKVVSESITTHEYESKVLAPAFTALTGIKITHDLIQLLNTQYAGSACSFARADRHVRSRSNRPSS